MKQFDSSLATTVRGDGSGTPVFGSPGARFVEAQGYEAIASGDRGQSWSTGPVQVGDLLAAKGTLLSTPGEAPTPPHFRPGIVESLFAPLGVADLFAQEATAAGQVRYARKSVAVNAAAGVAEGEEKPESALTFDEVEEPVRKVARCCRYRTGCWKTPRRFRTTSTSASAPS
jgi:HK97 family phage major capsid protein